MSLSEKQPFPDESHNADTLSGTDVIFPRLHMEHLIDEALQTGQLVFREAGVSRLSVDITPAEQPEFNAFGQPLNSYEYVKFQLEQREQTSSYKIRHDFIMQAGDEQPQRLSREYSLFFSGRRGERRFCQERSRCAVSIEPLPASDEGFRRIHNDGAPLSPAQASQLKDTRENLAAIEGYQMGEIKDLAVRALQAVHEHLTR